MIDQATGLFPDGKISLRRGTVSDDLTLRGTPVMLLPEEMENLSGFKTIQKTMGVLLKLFFATMVARRPTVIIASGGCFLISLTILPDSSKSPFRLYSLNFPL